LVCRGHAILYSKSHAKLASTRHSGASWYSIGC
jgi:hypothetical protein